MSHYPMVYLIRTKSMQSSSTTVMCCWEENKRQYIALIWSSRKLPPRTTPEP